MFVKLRFSAGYEVKTSPLIMRFGDDGGPVDPPEPVLVETGQEWHVPWRNGQAIESATTQRWTSLAEQRDFTLAWQTTEAVGQQVQCAWLNGESISQHYQLAFSSSHPLTGTDFTWRYASLLPSEQTTWHMRWRTKSPITGADFTWRWKAGPLTGIDATMEWWQSPHEVGQSVLMHWGPYPWQWICYWVAHPFPGAVKLRFDEQSQTHTGAISMRFDEPQKVCYWGLPGGDQRGWDDVPTNEIKVPIIAPVARSYLMQPTFTCVRVRDEMQIMLSSFTHQQSRGQFAAVVNLKFMSRIDQERAINELLRIELNGYEFYAWAESPSKQISFNNYQYSASGRSRVAELASPNKAPANYSNQTVQTIAGIMSGLLSDGWTLDSQVIDFPVPARAFNIMNKAPAEALNEAAERIGAMVLCDDSLKKVRIVPRWPVMPWDTASATCDVVLNEGVITSHSAREVRQPDFNVAFVRGEQEGVSCRVKRRETLGDRYAPEIVDSLITDIQAARQRGSAVLADSGKKEESTIKTKVMPQLPPLQPGQLIGIQYAQHLYKATCDTVTVSAAVDKQGRITINQSAGLVKNV
ncbi:hypothetical protein [Pseudoalteromonas ruthenica]|uniref:hypothetical protein n=1 Tax=Pseudoalteromonas ruthenica TaxID=151081 RepID=UPI00110B60C4|nr:hypothetical protein [Pseudoalteromonas ruthenica]TMP23785.1 hypothetical protein CWC06_09535 [Pseudoalteromonas ruthenica]